MSKWKSNKGLKIVLAIVSFLMMATVVCSTAAVALFQGLGAYDYIEKRERLENLYDKYSEIYAVMAISNMENPLMIEELDKTNFRYGIIREKDSGADGDLNEIKISERASYEYCNFDTMPEEDSLAKEEFKAIAFEIGENTRFGWECSLFGFGNVYNETVDYAWVEETKEEAIIGYYYNVTDGIFYYETEDEFYRVDEVSLPVGIDGQNLLFKYDSGQRAYYNLNPDECLLKDYYLTFNEFDLTDSSWESWNEIGLDGVVFGHTGIRFANDGSDDPENFMGKPIADHYYSYGDGNGRLTVRVEKPLEEETKKKATETYWVIYQVRDPLQKTGIRDSLLGGDLYEQITYLMNCAYAWRYAVIVILVAAIILWGVSTVLVLIMAGHKGSYEMVEVQEVPGRDSDSMQVNGSAWEKADPEQDVSLSAEEDSFVQEGAVRSEETDNSRQESRERSKERRKDFVKAERQWVDAIKPGFWQKIPLDVEICALVIIASLFLVFGIEISGIRFGLSTVSMAVTALCWSMAYILGLICLVDFVIRVKVGKWWRSMLTYKCLAWIWRIMKKAGRKLSGAFRFLQDNISLLWKAILILGGLCLLEFLGILVTGFDPEIELCIWFLYRLVTVALIMVGIVQINKLKNGAKKLADGDLQEKISTEKMFWEFKKHGENLNSIHDGISLAVEKRMQSEHFRTELITNVSHDIKTPLTSIINYVDLLQKEEIDNEKAKEYLEVLDRQSARLKKLTEDLIEASKASTGSMPVQMEQLELGVFLTQTVGEFEEKLTAAGLRVVMHKPEQEIFVNADGRHLWRVVENLVQNICKYAQPDTRVYIDLDDREKEAVISFKNISRYELNISGDELMERFVRGDSSRHTEGSGLGLSIAGSLMELMRGKLEIVVDGDLFKVVLRFPK